jgi:hypothetical protein
MKKKKSYVPIAKIKNALRRIHMHDKQKRTAKDRCKIDKATFKCEAEGCKIALYEGVSEKNYLATVKRHQGVYEVLQAKLELDHIYPVVEPKKGYADWNTYIERLYCSPEGYQGLCRDCHAEKSATEAAERAESGTLKRNK